MYIYIYIFEIHRHIIRTSSRAPVREAPRRLLSQELVERQLGETSAELQAPLGPSRVTGLYIQ